MVSEVGGQSGTSLPGGTNSKRPEEVDEAPKDLKKRKERISRVLGNDMELVAKWQIFSDLFVVSLSIHIPGYSIQKIKESYRRKGFILRETVYVFTWFINPRIYL